nr:MAG TPA: hypothetical protein [Caudoviricetes sp.]
MVYVDYFFDTAPDFEPSRGLFLLPNVKILTPCQFSPEIFWRFHFFFLPLPPLIRR